MILTIFNSIPTDSIAVEAKILNRNSFVFKIYSESDDNVFFYSYRYSTYMFQFYINTNTN